MTGGGVNLAVDGVGGKTLLGSIECTARKGRIVSFGQAGRERGRPMDVDLLSGLNKSVTGYSMAVESFMDPGRIRPMIERHLQDVASGS